jgi:hypothetical protein
MINDMSGVELVSQLAALPLVPQGTYLAIMPGENGAGFIQPVNDVLDYLDKRSKRESHEGEECLLITLTEDGQDEVKALYTVCAYVKTLSSGRRGISVSAACDRAFALYGTNKWLRRLRPKTFREIYDRWAKAKDWVALVNMKTAPATWRPNNRGLSEKFLDYCSQKFGEYGRADGKRQAIEAIKTIWRTGRNEYGEAEVIPGYENRWASRVREMYPDGWHYSNITNQINKRGKFTKAVRALMHEGTSAAKDLLPHNLRTRSALRFMEEVTFDDVRTDWLIFDPETGKPCELWLLVARDTATTMVLGFVMHPAHAREDETKSHLGLKEMKQLAAWLLERYPLPKDYIVHWKVERGTATLSKGSKAALEEMLPKRIQIHYTAMVGGKSPNGYREKKKGNSTGKASHESHNRLTHTQTSYVGGQTGSHYDIRPADLKARAEECETIWKELRPVLPDHLQGKERYTLLIPSEARAHLAQAFVKQNFRYDHAIEGFEKVLEWFDGANWQDRSKWSGQDGVKWRPRNERPVERAARLIAGHVWEHVSPDVIVAFLRHTMRTRPIEQGGEITTKFDGTQFTFAPAENATVPAPKTEVVCYFNENDPAFLHVTDGRGTFLGTWYRRSRNDGKDEQALKQAFRYTASTLAAVQHRAEALAAPTRQRIDEVHAHNTELLERGSEYIDIAKPELTVGDVNTSAPVAHALATAIPVEQQRTKKKQAEEADYERIAREALQNLHG